MNNDITEDYVSFDVAKLLKEKGFDCNSHSHYSGMGTARDIRYGITLQTGIGKFSKEFYNNSDLLNTFSILRPTTALAIKWIRENFGIHIYSTQIFQFNEGRDDYLQSKGFSGWITNTKDNRYVEKEETPPCMVTNYNSPEEAENAAIEYTLNNLL